MAIADILTRIRDEASAEAAAIVAQAETEAASLIAHTETTVAAERKATLEDAERVAADEAETLRANARLVARDELLTSKRAMAEGVLEHARESLETLPDDEYLEFIAARVARASAGGEMLSIATADAKRLGGLAARLEQLGVRVTLSQEPAPIERGVLLEGDRVRTEVSPAALVADHRDELLLEAARELFGRKA